MECIIFDTCYDDDGNMSWTLDPGASREAPGPTYRHNLGLVDVLALEAIGDAVLLQLLLPPCHVCLISLSTAVNNNPQYWLDACLKDLLVIRFSRFSFVVLFFFPSLGHCIAQLMKKMSSNFGSHI